MLELTNEGNALMETSTTGDNIQTMTYTIGACNIPANYQTYWYQSYPVYVYTDKTAKAIQILKS